MTEGPFEKPKSPEQLAVRVEIATEKDWETLKNLRIEAISGEDVKMFGKNSESVLRVERKTEQEWREDLLANEQIDVLSYVGSKAVGTGVAVEIEEGVWQMGLGYVNKNFRGQKLQPKMIAMRLLEIQRRGGKKVRVSIEVGNEASILNCASFGFEVGNPPIIEVEKNSEKFLIMELNNPNDPEVITKINEVLNAG